MTLSSREVGSGDIQTTVAGLCGARSLTLRFSRASRIRGFDYARLRSSAYRDIIEIGESRDAGICIRKIARNMRRPEKNAGDVGITCPPRERPPMNYSPIKTDIRSVSVRLFLPLARSLYLSFSFFLTSADKR